MSRKDLSNYSRYIRKIVITAVTIVFGISSVVFADWHYDWSDRTDRYGKPAGIFQETPFPIDENTISYSIMNDEHPDGKTFFVGDKFFVDAAGVDPSFSGECAHCSIPSDNSYDPLTRDCGSGTRTVYNTIKGGMAAASSGNKTVLVRAGIWHENRIPLRNGTDDTHRFLIVGYRQERPEVNGGDEDANIFQTAGTSGNIYCTLQRLKLTNTKAQGMQIGRLNTVPPKRDGAVNLIDMEAYECGNDYDNGSSGGFYFMNADNAWIYHCTSGHQYAHSFKIGDGSCNSLTEWSVAYDFGYWPGIAHAAAGHPSGFDYPDTGYNHELRYSIVHTGLFYAIQIRGNDSSSYEPNGVGLIKIHHNEIYDTTHFQSVDGESGHVTPCQVLLYKAWPAKTPSNKLYFYSNVVRDSADLDCHGVRLFSSFMADESYIYNNLFYGNKAYDLQIQANGEPVYVYSNSFYNNDTETLLRNDNGRNTTTINNIFYQAGSGSCSYGVDTGTHSNNLYYAPNGEVGLSTETSWQTPSSQNFWNSVPLGPYRSSSCTLTESSPARAAGLSLSSIFSTDMNGIPRTEWDLGPLNYDSGTTGTTEPPAVPPNARIEQ